MAEEILADGRFLRLGRLADGWEYVTRPNATGVVVIMPVTNTGEILFIEQFRPPVGTAVIEFPAGLAGDIQGEEDEALERAARRELYEECGYEAGRMTQLTAGPPSAGLTDEIITLFMATDLQKTGPGGGDAGENIIVHTVPVEQVKSWLEEQGKAGLMVDPKVYSGLYFLEKT